MAAQRTLTGQRVRDDSMLVRAVLRGTARPNATAPMVVGIALEVGLMFILGLFEPAHVLGLPGPLAVIIAAGVGVIAGPRRAVVVAAAGCVAYLAFLSQFGTEVAYPVVAASSVLWIAIPWVIARSALSLRRQVLARQRAQIEVEELYLGLEQGLLPRQHNAHPQLRAVTYYQPGEQRLRLGGDFVDMVALDEGSLALVIGDVSGHGPTAAALGAMLRGAWRGSVAAGLPTPEVARVLHHVVLEEAAEDAYATALIAVIGSEGKHIEALTAGHPAPLLLAGDPQPLPLAPGLPLGIGGLLEERQATTIDLPPEWSLLFYTDGLVEMRRRPGAPERFEEEGLIAHLVALRDKPLAHEDLRELVVSMAEASGEAPADDIAIVVVSG
jgi:serine phosphatase RsbU (regulator of sigma subunit)